MWHGREGVDFSQAVPRFTPWRLGSPFQSRGADAHPSGQQWKGREPHGTVLKDSVCWPGAGTAGTCCDGPRSEGSALLGPPTTGPEAEGVVLTSAVATLQKEVLQGGGGAAGWARRAGQGREDEDGALACWWLSQLFSTMTSPEAQRRFEVMHVAAVTDTEP